MSAPWQHRIKRAIRQFEDRAFGFASEVEYRLRITPRGVRLQPSPFDRRILRLFVVAMPTLVAMLFINDRGVRIRVLFGGMVALCVVLAILLLLDAMPARRSRNIARPASASRKAQSGPVQGRLGSSRAAANASANGTTARKAAGNATGNAAGNATGKPTISTASNSPSANTTASNGRIRPR
ncbi:MAG TPA: hypothetical protein VE869_00470 [Gemmatimonas sp.]|nr:hypothetical protein [Gemmatimonas sp.]